jgi:hypothetical protein
LFGAIATGADWVFIPENPVSGDWKERMDATIKKVALFLFEHMF